MRKKIFTFLLALAASVGMSWATENSIVINGTPQVGDNSISLTYYFDPANVSGICCYAPTLKVKCVTDNNWDEKWLDLGDISSGTETITLNTLGSFQAGKEYAICYAYYNGSWVDDVFQSVSFPAAPAPAGNVVIWNMSMDAVNGIVDQNETKEVFGGITIAVGAKRAFMKNGNVNALLFAFSSNTQEGFKGFTFANTLGVNFKKIVLSGAAGTFDGKESTGWVINDDQSTITWEGDAASVSIWETLNFIGPIIVNEVEFTLEGGEPAPQPEIGPKEVLDLGTTGCVGEHYQLTGGGTNIYRTVGGVDDKMITIESLHGEIIDNISLKLYYYNVWTGYSVAASLGDVSSWNYDAYEDLVITNINATSVTLSRVGSGQENGYVMFEKVTINNSDEPQPQPAEDVNITPNADPDHAGVYYSTFYDSANKYALPAGVEAYVADLSGANLLLTKIAEAGEVIPANVAVILKSTVTPFTLTPSDADAVTFTATNDLQGSDTQIATPANCYVLAGTDGVVGFYHYTAAMLNAHKAYVVYSGSNQAPRRMPFVFDQATGVENIQGDNVQSTKMMENGVLYIIKNGVKYNAQGQIVK